MGALLFDVEPEYGFETVIILAPRRQTQNLGRLHGGRKWVVAGSILTIRDTSLQQGGVRWPDSVLPMWRICFRTWSRQRMETDDEGGPGTCRAPFDSVLPRRSYFCSHAQPLQERRPLTMLEAG